jgi:hypothetical protein
MKMRQIKLDNFEGSEGRVVEGRKQEGERCEMNGKIIKINKQKTKQMMV